MIVWGIILVVVGVAAFVYAQAKKRDVHAFIGTETTPISELDLLHRTSVEVSGAGGFRRVCEVVATTQAGPTGLLTSEFARVPCVWHRHEVRRRYRQTTRDSQGRQQVSEQTETVTRQRSGQAILVGDGTGTIYVDPRGLQGDAEEQVLSRFEPRAEGDTIGYEHVEWVLRAGVQLYVHGEASDASGSLMITQPKSGPFVASRRTEEELKRSATRTQLISAYGGLAAFALGVVLLIVRVIR
jgi:hypothetical protein